jgi:hypothetical protein
MELKEIPLALNYVQIGKILFFSRHDYTGITQKKPGYNLLLKLKVCNKIKPEENNKPEKVFQDEKMDHHFIDIFLRLLFAKAH